MGTYDVSVKDGREMIRAARRRVLGAVSPAVFACVLMALWLAHHAPAEAAFFLGMAAAWLLSCFVTLVQLKTRYERICRCYTEPVFVSVEPEALQAETQHGSTKVRKSLVARTRAFPESFVVEFKTGNLSVLPRRHLSPEEVVILERWAKEDASRRK